MLKAHGKIRNPGTRQRFPGFGHLQQVLDAIPTSQPASGHVPGASPAHVAPLIPALPGSRGVGGTIKPGLSGDAAVAGPGWHSPRRFPNSPKNLAVGINSGFLESVLKKGSGKLRSAVGYLGSQNIQVLQEFSKDGVK